MTRRFMITAGLVLAALLIAGDIDAGGGDTPKEKTGDRGKGNRRGKTRINLGGEGVAGEAGPDLPLPIPDQLPNGAVRKFQRALSHKTFPYSGESAITVYRFPTVKDAAADLAGFVADADNAGDVRGKFKKVTGEDDEVLAAHGGAWRVETVGITALFHIDIYVVEVRLRAGGVTPREAFGVCVEIIEAEKKRRFELYSTIDRAFATFLKAADSRDERVLARCFPSSYAAEHRDFLDALVTLLKTQQVYSSNYGRVETLFLRAETEGAGGWAIVVLESAGSNYFYGPPWLMALQGSGRSRISRPGNVKKTYWIPYRREDEAWKINIAEIRKSGLIERDAPDNFARTVTFMRAVALAQEEFRARDGDGDKARDYARSFDELVKAGLLTGTLDGRAAWGYDFKFTAGDDGNTWTLTASPGKTEEEDPEDRLFLYIDQTGVVRSEKGKAAGSKSPEYSMGSASSAEKTSEVIIDEQ